MMATKLLYPTLRTVAQCGCGAKYIPANLVSGSQRHVSFWGSSKNSGKVADWNQAFTDAEKIVGYSTSFMSLRYLLSDEFSNVAMQMRKLVGTKHPLLKTARRFIFDGKHSMQTRGLIVLLVSKAAGMSKFSRNIGVEDDDSIQSMSSGICPSQRNLAEITEMIHTAYLVHKGVVNMADLLPCDGSVEDMHLGNKMAVLSGDFLLANASTGLAQLHNTHVVELMSSAIGDLVEAEFTALRDEGGNAWIPAEGASMETWDQQTYLSAGSLLSKACKSALMLANHAPEIVDKAFDFGKHVAYAYQLTEDLQPFTHHVDDQQPISLTSAPVMQYLIDTGNRDIMSMFNNTTDNTKIIKLLENSPALEKVKQRCLEHGKSALDNLSCFSHSDARTALRNIVEAISLK